MESKNTPLKTVSVRIPPALYNALEVRASDAGMSLSAWSRQAIELGLDHALMLDRFELLTQQLAGDAARTTAESSTELHDVITAAQEVFAGLTTAMAEQAIAQRELLSHIAHLATQRTAPPSTGWSPGKGVPD